MKKISEQQLLWLNRFKEGGIKKLITGNFWRHKSGYIPTATANSLIKRGLVSVASDGTCEVTEQGKQYCNN